jgi:serine/threonine protein kinase
MRGLKGFLEEARHLSQFSHANIVAVARFLETNGTGYLVMEYERGGTLRSLMRSRKGGFGEEEVRAVLLPLCAGLSALHAENLLHRDIKPDNILIRESGDPVLIDFGATVDLEYMEGDDWIIVATPGYAPPEQFSREAPHGPWIDIYAIGATIYEMISGVRLAPFPERLRGQEVGSAAAVARGNYSTALLSLVDRCIDLDYRVRPASLSELTLHLLSDEQKLIEQVVTDVSRKAIRHFANFARPNEGLFADEFAAFILSFTIIDLAWRFGTRLPTKEMADRVSQYVEKTTLDLCAADLANAGFTNNRGRLTRALLLQRLDEYAAAYLLDRQAEDWKYELLRRQATKNSLFPKAQGDALGFSSLIENVIDRARGRVKKAVEKALLPYAWVQTPSGWERILRDQPVP